MITRIGPIRPVMSPSSTATEASSTALKAPKALVTLRASISTGSPAALEQRQQAARQEAGDDHEDRADQAGDVALLDRDRGVVDRLEGAEGLGDVAGVDQHGITGGARAATAGRSAGSGR